jgi:hypothetical protein
MFSSGDAMSHWQLSPKGYGVGKYGDVIVPPLPVTARGRNSGAHASSIPTASDTYYKLFDHKHATRVATAKAIGLGLC